MSPVLLDTNALVWNLAGDPKLTNKAKAEIERSEKAGLVYVSVATRMDLHYLARSAKFTKEQASSIWKSVVDPNTAAQVVSLTTDIVETSVGEILADSFKDPWDRFIVATALRLRVPLVTSDHVMHQLGEQGFVDIIW